MDVVTINKSMLLISCSNIKKWDIATPQPAFEVYNGVIYRVIKKSIKSKPDIKDKFTVYILSAKYNVIPAHQNILPYDLKMSKSLSLKNRDNNTCLLKKYINLENPSDLVVVMGKTYRNSIDWGQIDISTRFIIGQIGEMQSQLKKWLLSL